MIQIIHNANTSHTQHTFLKIASEVNSNTHDDSCNYSQDTQSHWDTDGNL